MNLEVVNHLRKAAFLDPPNPEIRTARGGLGSPAWSAGGPDGLVSSLLRARVA